jgi:hypothetical protein
VRRRQLEGGGNGIRAIGGRRARLARGFVHIPRACQGSGVRSVLLHTPLIEILSDVEDKRRNHQDDNQASGEDREYLAALVPPPINC